MMKVFNMKKSHNKKRNIGIIYEQTIKHICNAIIEKDNKTAKKGIKIISELFREGTQLNKEYKLFKALVTTKNINENLASSIIKEAKKACNYHFDNEQLQKEKSLLIKELNYSFGKGKIFEYNIENYKEYATIQMLLNEWRDNSEKDIEALIDYEIKLHNSLTEKRDTITELELNENNIFYNKTKHENLLKEFNEIKKNNLKKDQIKLFEYYLADDFKSLKIKFNDIKNESLKLIDNYINESSNSFIKEKYLNVNKQIENINTKNVSSENLKKFLTLIDLKEEIKSGD